MKNIQVIKNAGWIIICKIIQSIMQMIIGMMCARYLGPSNYGLINYASSVVAFALPVMKLGFDATLVGELIKEPDKEGEIMGTSLCMNIGASVICMAAVTLYVSVVNANDSTVMTVCILYSISLICAAVEMIQYWFQYKLLSKYSSVVMLVVYIVVSIYRITILAFSKSIYWFAVTNVLDYGLIGITLLALYLKKGTQPLSFSVKRAKALFSRSKYYIFASLMVRVVQNTDHIMLTTFLSKAENGFYSAAITCISVLQFVYTGIIDSFRPLILHAKKIDEIKYKTLMAMLYGIICYLMFAQNIVFLIGADLIVRILYGMAYLEAVPVLRILTFFHVFSVMGSIRNVWILAEQKQKYLPIINLLAAGSNVGLNAFFIPRWGACGAAFASLLTQFFANYILGFLIEPMRENNRLLLRGLRPGFLITQIRKFLSENRL